MTSVIGTHFSFVRSTGRGIQNRRFCRAVRAFHTSVLSDYERQRNKSLEQLVFRNDVAEAVRKPAHCEWKPAHCEWKPARCDWKPAHCEWKPSHCDWALSAVFKIFVPFLKTVFRRSRGLEKGNWAFQKPFSKICSLFHSFTLLFLLIKGNKTRKMLLKRPM